MRACHSKVVVRTIALRVRGAWGATVHTSLRGKLLGRKDGTNWRDQGAQGRPSRSRGTKALADDVVAHLSEVSK